MYGRDYICIMERYLQVTQDGSHTIAIPGMQVTYHSTHGAVQESLHVYIRSGLHPVMKIYPMLRIFEMGFGTGLNALLTLQHAEAQHQQVYYETVELYPLSAAEVQWLNYNDILLKDSRGSARLEDLHAAPWEQDVQINPLFSLHKKQCSLFHYLQEPPQEPFNLIYFDAFDPRAQPELWAQSVFEQLFHRLHPDGVLVTYCSKGSVRRAMQAAGFLVEKLPGPPGKREMVRARRKALADSR
jgi:tRNA U34 5-methylaminomethyl-2-thiouridine-forming methyltransferase MnmC